MRLRKNRDQIILATKGAHPELATMHVSRLSRAEIVHDLDESFRNLGTDVIDLYWLHCDDPAHPIGAILETLTDQVKAGKFRSFTTIPIVACWTVEQLQDSLSAAEVSLDPDQIRYLEGG